MANDKKTLLEEGTVRRFMKLAEIAPLTDSFLEEYDVVQEEEEVEMDMAMADPMPEDPMPEDPMAGEEELELDLGAEEAPEGEEGEVTLTDDEVDSLVAAFDAAEGVVEKLRGAGEEVAPEEIEAVDMGGEEELEMDMEPVDEEPGLEGEEEAVDELEEISVVDDEDLVNEVVARVAKRLLTKKNA